MTVPVTANVLLRGQLAYLREQGFHVTVISSPGPELDEVAARERVDVVPVTMAREISIAPDIASLQNVTEALQKLEPDIVNASTAKAGLLGMVASAALRVPIRMYLLRGLRLETERGLKRTILGVAERLAAGCAHRVICNSESLRSRYIAEGFAPAGKCKVLGAGSSNGIDVERFARERWELQARELRRTHEIPKDAPVIGFVGRPVADKGITELLDAFELVRERVPDARLVLVGAGFAGDQVDMMIAPRLRRAHVHLIDRVAEPAPYYAMMNVLAFPSHREGFPNAPLEAAAASIPTVGTRATGVRDAIIDGTTGALVDVGDVDALANVLVRYVSDRKLATTHGRAARDYAATHYAKEVVWERWRDEYVRLLRARGLPLPAIAN